MLSKEPTKPSEPSDIHASKEIAEKLYLENYDYIHRTASVLLQDKFIADDIVQEAFFKAFKNWNQLRDIGKFRPWLSTIATNLCRNHFHKSKREIPIQDIHEADHNTNLEDNVLSKLEGDDYIETVLRSLGYDDREILMLRYYHELSNKDIAQHYQITIGATYVRLFRAKEKFKKVYAKIRREG